VHWLLHRVGAWNLIEGLDASGATRAALASPPLSSRTAATLLPLHPSALPPCSMAAAFNAPIGGVLFSYEEAASFWSKSLTWRAFFCAMVAAYVIDIFMSGLNDGTKWGQLSSPGACGRLASDYKTIDMQ